MEPFAWVTASPAGCASVVAVVRVMVPAPTLAIVSGSFAGAVPSMMLSPVLKPAVLRTGMSVAPLMTPAPPIVVLELPVPTTGTTVQ